MYLRRWRLCCHYSAYLHQSHTTLQCSACRHAQSVQQYKSSISSEFLWRFEVTRPVTENTRALTSESEMWIMTAIDNCWTSILRHIVLHNCHVFTYSRHRLCLHTFKVHCQWLNTNLKIWPMKQNISYYRTGNRWTATSYLLPVPLKLQPHGA